MTKSETGDVRTVSSEVTVRVDPDTAFSAFTEELDLWWVRGPINHWSGGRVAAMRCEPGIGGRLLEVYDDDALELGRITAWEPGRLFAWSSSVDDVETEVTFVAVGASTVVRVTARIPSEGVDRGGTAWTRVVPRWFGSWCARRDVAPREVQDICRLGVAVYYEKPAAAARWLAEVFGLQPAVALPEGTDPLPDTDHGHPWIEFHIGSGSLIVFELDEAGDRVASHIPWVYVDDIQEHFHRAESAGAVIVDKLDAPWGLPMYTAKDLEGNHWTFAQARPTM